MPEYHLDKAVDKNRKCPYCDHQADLKIQAKDINRNISTETFVLYECQDCGLMFVGNPPDNLALYYSSDYHFRPQVETDLLPFLAQQKYKIEIIQKFKTQGKFLEIGPSSGFLCKLAKDASFDVHAIEIDTECVNFLNKALKIKAIESGDPASVLLNYKETFDVICLWHAIEHLEKPWDVLSAAVERLNPGGILLVAAPNQLSWQARLLGARWPHYDLPRHLFEISPVWLRKFAVQLGISEVFFTTNDQGSKSYTYFSWRQSFEHLTNIVALKPFLRRIGTLFGRTIRIWEMREGNGAGYIMVLKRSNP